MPGQRLNSTASARPDVGKPPRHLRPVRSRLSTAEIQAELERVSYKPGWTFTCYDGRWEGQHLAITVEVPDATRPGRTVTLDVHSSLPPSQTCPTCTRGWRGASVASRTTRCASSSAWTGRPHSTRTLPSPTEISRSARRRARG